MWGSKVFDVEIDTSKTVEALMETLQKLTGVPVARQTLMMRRKALKPGDAWGPELKPGTRFMMIGTAEALPEQPETRPEEEAVEEEVEEGRLSEKELERIRKGLPNLGNTCYLNACLQTLRLLPKFTSILLSAEIPAGPGERNVTKTIADMFRDFPRHLNLVIAALQNVNPALFKARDENGLPMQQDATEAWQFLLRAFDQTIGPPISRLFEIGFEITRKCAELDKTEVDTSFDNRLPIYINEEVKQLEQGVRMDGEIERECPELGHPVVWQEHKAIARLPPYLVCQMMRFTYKQDEKITAKLLRRVNHPKRLDTLSWLAPELRKEVVADRENPDGNHNRGFYKLKAVLTHRGRSADSGHYITHVRIEEQWFRFDDEKVTEIEEEDVDMLGGSGDWHCSILLIYEAE